MIPVLYSATETAFTSNGLGALSDASSCIVTEERNGVFELEMEYPLNGQRFKDISEGCFIYSKYSDGEDPQPFEIYKITTPISGSVTIYARHMRYRMSYIPVEPFYDINGFSNVLSALKTNSVGDNPFNFITDIVDEYGYSLGEPTSLANCLAGGSNSIVEIFGGELKWDKYNVYILKSRGIDRGVRIAYSKNMTDFKHEVDLNDVVTAAYGYWKKNNKYLKTGIINSSYVNNYTYKRTAILDLSRMFDDEPTVEQLEEKTKEYLDKECKGVADVNITVSFAPLWKSEEYANLAPLQVVKLCDIVTVEYPEIGISVKKKVVKTEFDALKDRYTSIELGDNLASSLDRTIVNTVKSSSEELDDKIDSQSKDTDNKINWLEQSLKEQTELMNGGRGGYIIFGYDPDTGKPTEIIIGDKPSRSEMVHCIRINQNGVGFSNTGYNGTFITAWTIDGQFNAQFIGANSIKGNQIESGSLTIGNFTEDTQVMLNDKFDTLYSGMSDLKIALENSNLDGYVRIVGGNIEIGSKDHPVKFNITNDIAGFSSMFGNLAYIKYNRFCAPNYGVGTDDNMYDISNEDGLLFTAQGE